ncbi:MAG: C-terminal binding protein [Eubacteriaceae bacterium]|jgi:D-3-phosphoglycerate dehydrogenase|nr:C-terminal binding protein [Eubacteriaceae bacterium]
MYEVVITTDIADDEFISIAKDVLKDFANVQQIICHTEEDLIKNLQNADATISIFEPFTEKVFAALPNLKFVSVSGVGFNFIDVKAAAAHGVGVCNNPHYCVDEVADHTVALILALERKLTDYYLAVKEEKVWNSFAQKGHIRRLSTQTVGLIGFGNIARRVCKRMQAFGCPVIAYDPFVNQESADPYNVKMVKLEELYKNADIISLHLPLMDSTKGMIDKKAFEIMSSKKPYFINCSRGGVVDENALVNALRTGQLSGAGIDAITSENPDCNNLPLAELGTNVIVTPHAAFLSDDALKEQKITTSQFIKDFILGNVNAVPVVNGVKSCK